MHKITEILFFFKKNTPLLKDIIPDNYLDIHSHLLPAIDDGSKNIEDTLQLLNQLKLIGFTDFITTPHVMSQVWENSKLSIEENYSHTASAIKSTGFVNSFNVAAEYMMDMNFCKILQEEKLLTLKDNYVLVEMSYLSAPLQLYEILFDLQIAGYKPILAHPERYNFYHNNTQQYRKLKQAGCLFQLNLLSLVGYYGPNITATADFLLKNNLIDFVGSDVHHMKHVSHFNTKIVIKNIEPLKDIFNNNLIFKH